MAYGDGNAYARLRSRFLAAVGVFVVGALVGAVFFPRPEATLVASPETAASRSYSTLYFATRNGGVLLLMLFGGCFLGVVTLGTLLHNGYLIGGLVGAAITTGTSPWLLLAYMGPHGVFELTGFFLAAAVGFDVALYFVDRIRNHETVVLDDAPARLWLRGAALALSLIALAAAIEANLTPAIAEFLFAT